MCLGLQSLARTLKEQCCVPVQNQEQTQIIEHLRLFSSQTRWTPGPRVEQPERGRREPRPVTADLSLSLSNRIESNRIESKLEGVGALEHIERPAFPSGAFLLVCARMCVSRSSLENNVKLRSTKYIKAPIADVGSEILSEVLPFCRDFSTTVGRALPFGAAIKLNPTPALVLFR